MQFEIVKNIITKGINFRIGIYSGIFLTALLITIFFSSNLILPKAWNSEKMDLGVGERQMYFQKNNQILSSVDILNVSGQCVDLVLKHDNGQYYSGLFCEGEHFQMNEFQVRLDKIYATDSLEKPIRITIYKTINLRGFIIFLLVFLPILAIIDELLYIRSQERKILSFKKRKDLAKKFNVKPNDIQKLFDLFNDEDDK